MLLISLDQNTSILLVNDIYIYILRILRHFDTENYTWRLYIVQNLCEF